jgi:hypothetical protein
VAISRHGVDGGDAVADVDVTLTYNDDNQLATISRYLDGALTVTATYSYDSARNGRRHSYPLCWNRWYAGTDGMF